MRNSYEKKLLRIVTIYEPELPRKDCRDAVTLGVVISSKDPLNQQVAEKKYL